MKNQYGEFIDNKAASYQIKTMNTPVPWEFIYQNQDILLKVDQYGPVYIQEQPPSGLMMIKREPYQKVSSWLTWIEVKGLWEGPVSNYFRPNLLGKKPGFEPDNISIHYFPEKAVYEYEYKGIWVQTQLIVPITGRDVLMEVKVRNETCKAQKVFMTPVLRPYINKAQLAPWDRPEWYLKSSLCRGAHPTFITRLLNMDSKKEERRTAALILDEEDFESFDISYENFLGQGTYEKPACLYKKDLSMAGKNTARWGTFDSEASIYGYPPVYALRKIISLEPGESYTLKQVFCMVEEDESGLMPEYQALKAKNAYLDKGQFEVEEDKVSSFFNSWMKKRHIKSHDSELDRFVNEWLALEMYWVASLDRGWPSGMRGSRDAANDFTSMVALDPAWSKEILETLFSCQETNGWFPRQISAQGRKGSHDMRKHVDAGCWVIELLYEYLCFTKDFEFLERKLPWLNWEESVSVGEHALRSLDYYLERRGEHGLCLIGEGDWLDSVNRAGLKGRGESVTVSNQLIIAMTYMKELWKSKEVKRILKQDQDNYNRWRTRISEYGTSINDMIKAINDGAFNDKGFYNSVFTDGGYWIFSDKDPDGRLRMYGPANWYSVASGVADSKKQESVFHNMNYLKKDMGYALYHPPMGDIPIDYVGRSGSGDMPFGLWENGNVYNQGSHGFLGRALAVSGKGDNLHEVIRYMLPFDQEKHPSEKVMTPPYAVVNCWQQVPGFNHRGGLSFLTGSTAMALRMIYDWVCGIKPRIEGLSIDPCVSKKAKHTQVEFAYLDTPVTLTIENPCRREAGIQYGTLNGEIITDRIKDLFSQRSALYIEDSYFTGKPITICVSL